jgi:3-phosphoshikimate 1-carboxyvinyltransferase
MRNTDPITISPSRDMRATLRVPSDKSITHRALFFGAINRGTTTIIDPSPADDCRRTFALVEALGRDVEATDGRILLRDSIASNDAAPLALDCGNSGTTARLAMGLLAAEPGVFTLHGDSSLERRPMERVAAPLRRLGATIDTTDGRLPARIVGASDLVGGDSHGLIAVESAQVHAALVLAALRSTAGATLFVARPMRDHTLRMLKAFGCEPMTSGAGVHRILPSILSSDVVLSVPGDFSSAAFFIAAAVLVPGSEITIEDVGLNPTRTAFLRALAAMGADIEIESIVDAIEPRGRIIARHAGALRATTFGSRGYSDFPIMEMIDELPLLALIATQANGTTSIIGAEELRVKESDRIAATAAVLRALGATVTERPDR